MVFHARYHLGLQEESQLDKLIRAWLQDSISLTHTSDSCLLRQGDFLLILEFLCSLKPLEQLFPSSLTHPSDVSDQFFASVITRPSSFADTLASQQSKPFQNTWLLGIPLFVLDSLNPSRWLWKASVMRLPFHIQTYFPLPGISAWVSCNIKNAFVHLYHGFIPSTDMSFIYSFFLRFYLFTHERHRERGRDTGRGRSRLPAGSPMWDSIPGPWGHALGQRQTLNHWATQASLPPTCLECSVHSRHWRNHFPHHLPMLWEPLTLISSQPHNDGISTPASLVGTTGAFTIAKDFSYSAQEHFNMKQMKSLESQTSLRVREKTNASRASAAPARVPSAKRWSVHVK